MIKFVVYARVQSDDIDSSIKKKLSITAKNNFIHVGHMLVF